MTKQTQYIPERGDIIFLDFDPTLGHEQAGHRLALVLSPQIYNDKVGLAVVAPITNTIKNHGFEVIVNTPKTTGVVLIHQLKTIDFEARSIAFNEKASSSMISEALKKASLIFK